MPPRITRNYPIHYIICSVCGRELSLNSTSRLQKLIDNPVNIILGNGGGGSEDYLRDHYKCQKCRPKLRRKRQRIKVVNPI